MAMTCPGIYATEMNPQSHKKIENPNVHYQENGQTNYGIISEILLGNTKNKLLLHATMWMKFKMC